jgi:DNA-binding GntR family transcriptional regulator
MEKYGVSRYMIRYVIKRLEIEGFIETIPNRGAKVRKIFIPEIEEIFNLLIILESKAAELAALMRNESEIDTLYKLYEDTLEYTVNRDYNGWAEANEKIHAFISNLSTYQILPKLITDLRNRIYRQRFLLSIGNYIEKYNEEHKKIIDSISNKMPYQSGEFMKLHMETSKQNRINLFINFRNI